MTEDPGRQAYYLVEIEMIERLKQIDYFAKRIAYGVVPKEFKTKAL